jgi:hypothetical protein
LKPRVPQQFPGMVVEDQLGQVSIGVSDNHRVGHGLLLHDNNNVSMKIFR